MYNELCPTRVVLDRITDKWTVLIVGALEDKTKRFGELCREMGGVSQKMLTRTLRGLERNGLVTRIVYASVPPKVEYSPTELGRTLVNILEQVRDWAENNIGEVLKSSDVYDKKNASEESVELLGIDVTITAILKDKARQEETSVNTVMLRILKESLGIEKKKRLTI